MLSYLKQSTASQTRILGPFLDDTDGKTAETGLTIANTDIKLSANGGSSANKNSGGGTHIVNGNYAVTFDATDTATVGELHVSCKMSGALQVGAKFVVLEEAIYDALFGASAAGFDSNGRVDVGALVGGTQSATDLKDFADTGYDPSSHKVAGVVLVDTTTTNTDMRGTDSAALASNWTSTRAGYLDNLNVGGNVASSAEVTAIQNNTRVVRSVPVVIERPDSGTATYRIELLSYDATGNMEAPDSAPTVDLVDQGGTDLSSRLDSATGTLVSTGRYRWIYTASDTDDLEQLNWTFSVVEGSATRLYTNTTLIVDTTAVDFTSADRTKLDAILTDTDSTLPGFLASILGDTNELQTDWANGGRLDLLIDAIKAVTDAIPDSGAMTSIAQESTVSGLNNISATDVWAAGTRTLTAGTNLSFSTFDPSNDEIESGVTYLQGLRAACAALAGILSGANGSTITIKAIGAAADGTTRITATVDADGNRSAVTLNL